MTDATLLTGATGFLGMELLAQLADRDDRPVLALVRAPDQAAADARLAGVRAAVFGDPRAHADRIRAVPADLERDNLGLDARTRDAVVAQTSEIVHGAASVSFAQPIDEARAVNVAGSRRVLDLASDIAERGSLRRMVHVSTAYVSGNRRGDCSPDTLDPRGPHRNSYERSKAEAEALARGWMERVPLTVVRPAIVVGHSETGWTASFNVIYGPLRAFASGALTTIPGRRDAPVDVVPVDYVGAATVALLGAPDAAGRTFHLSAGEHAARVGPLATLAAQYTGHEPPRIISPRLYRRLVHPILKRTGDPRRRAAVRRGEVYLPYFAVRAHYDNSATRAALDGLGVAPAPPVNAYFGRLMQFADRAAWGKQPVSRAEAAADRRRFEPAPAPLVAA